MVAGKNDNLPRSPKIRSLAPGTCTFPVSTDLSEAAAAVVVVVDIGVVINVIDDRGDKDVDCC